MNANQQSNIRKSRLIPFSLLTITLLILILAACTSRPATEGETSSSSDSSELIDNLRSAGATIETAGIVEQPFFQNAGQLLKVNGADVQVFEFPDEASWSAAVAQISPDGTSVGTSMITWIDQPHFWAKNPLVVLYVGSDAEIINLLTTTLGKPIAPVE